MHWTCFHIGEDRCC